jgi:hypothetical protein
VSLPAPRLDPAAARRIVANAIDRYVEARHARVEPFVDANFGLLASLRLHRRALGWDLVRAPANVALVGPYLATRLAASGLSRVGARGAADWLRGRRFFLGTDVARELEWRLHTDMLELPFEDGDRRSDKDALAAAILADPEFQAFLAQLAEPILRHRDEPETRARLRAHVETYSGARSAAADIVGNLVMASTGAAAFQQLTPGAISLGPVLATAIAHQAAVASFPLGAGLGSLWYGWFAVQPSVGLVAGVTGGLVLAAAVTAAFAGVVADPVQKALGLHQRRLHQLVELRGDSEVAFEVRDHYVARLFDLVDFVRGAARLMT